MIQGVDFPDVKFVCNAGLPNNIADALQRGGRVGRQDGSQGLFVIFYDTWALSISLDKFNCGHSDDPDQPQAMLKPNATRMTSIVCGVVL